MTLHSPNRVVQAIDRRTADWCAQAAISRWPHRRAARLAVSAELCNDRRAVVMLIAGRPSLGVDNLVKLIRSPDDELAGDVAPKVLRASARAGRKTRVRVMSTRTTCMMRC